MILKENVEIDYNYRLYIQVYGCNQADIISTRVPIKCYEKNSDIEIINKETYRVCLFFLQN